MLTKNFFLGKNSRVIYSFSKDEKNHPILAIEMIIKMIKDLKLSK